MDSPSQSSNQKLTLIYTTLGSEQEAIDLANLLITKKVAACVNLIGPLRSFYTWDNKATNSTEWALVCKTPTELSQKLMKFIKDHHPYQVPCLWSQELSSCDPDYLNWAQQVTQKT